MSFRRFSERPTMHTLTEINVTPLLDLAFVLLIIFIITTPLMENSVNLVVPTSTEANQAIDRSQVQVVAIDKDEVIRLNDQVVDAGTLEARLGALHADKPDAAVLVRPDRSLSVQKFIGIMDILERAKIPKVGVLTRPNDSSDVGRPSE